MQYWKEGGFVIGLKNKEELQAMREGGKILGQILVQLQQLAQPGITCLELNAKAEELMRKYGVLPSFKGYNGFPAVICTNVNDQVVHGIPTNYTLRDGDLLTIDAGVIHKDFHTDSAVSFGVGVGLSTVGQKLIKTAEKALAKAIEKARPGIRVGQLSAVIQDTVEREGFTVVRELIGHGIGHHLHEDPEVPNFRDGNPGALLQPGMTIAIEPIITAGRKELKLLDDDWTYITKDKSLAAQVEHTIAITDKGAEVLTARF